MITIIGGGPGGLLLARLLYRQGIPCQVIETDTAVDSRHQGGMLDLHEDTGQRALRQAGLFEAFQSAVLEGGDATRILDPQGNIRFEDIGNGERPEIDRMSLRKLLVDSLPPGIIRWGSKLTAVEDKGDHFALRFADGTVEQAEVVIGADGAWSRVRPILTDITPTYTGVTFVELRYLNASVSSPTAHHMVGDGLMFALGESKGFVAHREPNDEVCVYAALRVPEDWLQSAITKELLAAQFTDWDASYQALVFEADSLERRSLYALPIGLRWPRHSRATLLGDAAHLMSPFAG
ncbi:MAG: FAD-dependent monooxygenase [Armatimonas sp.]